MTTSSWNEWERAENLEIRSVAEARPPEESTVLWDVIPGSVDCNGVEKQELSGIHL